MLERAGRPAGRSHARSAPEVSFEQALRYWLLLGFTNFGGPTGQIAMMHRELVERRRWISEERFLHALNYCMLLPGPEAQQLAIYVGWLLHGTWGGIVAGSLFVIPSIFILLALSYLYVAYGTVPVVAALFYGLKPAVIAVVVVAVIRIGRRALRSWLLCLVAAAAFVGIFALAIPFPALIVGAGLVGLLVERWRPLLVALPVHSPGGDASAGGPVAADTAPPHAPPTLRRSLIVVGVAGTLWVTPIVAVALWRGTASVLFQEAMFFSKAAMVTFGGAYAVLAYIRDMAVEHYGWLAPGQMMDGLGLAETTPGPLIMVTQFVGFLGAWRHPEGLTPLTAGVLGALITTWVTFVPCFLWIFLGAPFIEQLRGSTRLGAAFSAITAAVAGVVVHLAVVFATHALVPAPWQVDLFSVAVTLGAFGLLHLRDWSMPLVIGLCAALGLAWRLATGS